MLGLRVFHMDFSTIVFPLFSEFTEKISRGCVACTSQVSTLDCCFFHELTFWQNMVTCSSSYQQQKSVATLPSFLVPLHVGVVDACSSWFMSLTLSLTLCCVWVHASSLIVVVLLNARFCAVTSGFPPFSTLGSSPHACVPAAPPLDFGGGGRHGYGGGGGD